MCLQRRLRLWKRSHILDTLGLLSGWILFIFKVVNPWSGECLFGKSKVDGFIWKTSQERRLPRGICGYGSNLQFYVLLQDFYSVHGEKNINMGPWSTPFLSHHHVSMASTTICIWKWTFSQGCSKLLWANCSHKTAKLNWSFYPFTQFHPVPKSHGPSAAIDRVTGRCGAGLFDERSTSQRGLGLQGQGPDSEVLESNTQTSPNWSTLRLRLRVLQNPGATRCRSFLAVGLRNVAFRTWGSEVRSRRRHTASKMVTCGAAGYVGDVGFGLWL